MMEPIAIQLKEPTTGHRAGEPLRFGVPLLQGALKNTSRLQLSDNDNAPLPTQSRPLSHWPDGSVRWVCVETLLPAIDTPLATLTLSESSTESQNPALISQGGDQLQVRYNDYQLTVDPALPGWQWSGPENQSFSSRLRVDDRDNKACSALLDKHWQIRSTGPVVTVLEATGWWHDNQNDRLARFRCELNFYASGLVTAEASIHNPRRARHSGGLWDLGDPGSIHFGSMAIETDTTPTGKYRLCLSAEQPPRQFDTDQHLTLHQESSGGENWNSTNHINALGQVLPRYRGYRLNHGNHEPEDGLRADPVIEARTAESTISISLPHFWQNFPSALEADNTILRAWLFPADKPEAYELQGGERKSQKVILGYGMNLEKLNWSHSPLVPVLSPEHYEAADAFPWFNSAAGDDRLQALIRKGIDGPDNFFRKRETIDEYGWRNFGDLFADHETLYQQPDEQPFISHYNNQYDPIYGFARQFALTGDTRWHELMDDLGHHVKDIDIYHTDEDRVEYNNGLFWHTDHYLDAHTATHRTFSRHNTTSSTPGQTGGGPSEEHCYTTGLLYHYWMTGSESSRSAVVDLASWISAQREGDQTFLGQLDVIKRRDLPAIKRSLKDEDTSYRQYPFTRGTGNYLNALLDAHTLEPDGRWIEKAEQVIRSTVHPDDDPAERNLLNAEVSWSYLVFLSSLSRFIQMKLSEDQTDSGFHYALGALRTYILWIRDFEQPFLKRADELEFPNDTWVAQDFRKAALLFQATAFFPDTASSLYDSAVRWLSEVAQSLAHSTEQNYTRILVILMQNVGPHTFKQADLCDLFAHQLKIGSAQNLQKHPNKIVKPSTVLLRSIRRLVRALKYLNLRKEIAWLSFRLQR
jgi:hypothetical protein